jgi:glyoxylase-like metal-dependent hydrolase (beta-lactamase superfamily II)
VPITYRRINLGFVSAYLLVRGNEAAVIDTGIAGSAAAVGDALDAASLDWTAVRHVLLTHHHPDHAGSIGDVLTAAVNATAYAGEADVASITAPRTVSSVVDGDEVFGLQIVGTPGHTAGHIAIYDPLGKVLVAGDAINNVDGLSGPNPQFSSDMVTALESAKALANISLDTIFFGHGDPIEGGAGLRLREAAANW